MLDIYDDGNDMRAGTRTKPNHYSFVTLSYVRNENDISE